MRETAIKKTGRGRRKIPIQKIENKAKRCVTFSKRRSGLFKKASELSTLCASDVALVVFSESSKPFTFGHPSAHSVIRRYLRGSDSTTTTTQSPNSANPIDGAFGCDECVDRLGLDELRLYYNYLQNIRDIVAAKAASMATTTTTTPPPHVSYHGNQNTSSHGLFVQEKEVSIGGLEMQYSKYYLEELKTGLDVERPTAESSEYMLCGEGMTDPTTSSNEKKYVDDVQGDVDLSKYLEEVIDFDVESPTVDSPTDVNGDTQLLSDDDCSKGKEADSSEHMFVGEEGAVNDGYAQTDVDLDAQWSSSLCDIKWEEDDLDLFTSFLPD